MKGTVHVETTVGCANGAGAVLGGGVRGPDGVAGMKCWVPSDRGDVPGCLLVLWSAMSAVLLQRDQALKLRWDEKRKTTTTTAKEKKKGGGNQLHVSFVVNLCSNG